MPKALDVAQLKTKANDIRKLIIRITTEAGSGHPSSSLSATDVVTALYFGGFMQFDPRQPDDPGRDREVRPMEVKEISPNERSEGQHGSSRPSFIRMRKGNRPARGAL